MRCPWSNQSTLTMKKLRAMQVQGPPKHISLQIRLDRAHFRLSIYQFSRLVIHSVANMIIHSQRGCTLLVRLDSALKSSMGTFFRFRTTLGLQVSSTSTRIDTTSPSGPLDRHICPQKEILPHLVPNTVSNPAKKRCLAPSFNQPLNFKAKLLHQAFSLILKEIANREQSIP